MCFAIPYKVLAINQNLALLENGVKARIGHEYVVSPGDYVEVAGNIVVSVLSPSIGRQIRKRIKTISSL